VDTFEEEEIDIQAVQEDINQLKAEPEVLKGEKDGFLTELGYN
jgi:hypothetical protein